MDPLPPELIHLDDEDSFDDFDGKTNQTKLFSHAYNVSTKIPQIGYSALWCNKRQRKEVLNATIRGY